MTFADGRRTLRPSVPVQTGVVMAGAGWVLDQSTKALVLASLDRGDVVPLPGPMFLRLTFNRGAAFSAPIPWWVFPIVTLVVVVLVARNLPQAAGVAEPFAWGLLLAGALGNITDRIVRGEGAGVGRGEVVDFIASHFWPAFNVADVCITVGFALLLLVALRHGREEQPESA